ncbi:MAG: glycosyl hydrolase [Bacteroidota bacterium]|nr:glycosyl hydrolase [Bacteroidota bacterium]
MIRLNILLVLACLFGLDIDATAQRSKKNEDDGVKDISSEITGLSFRHVGPALMSGRVADIVIHPDNSNVWYVAVGSGGVWKTENSGTTWTSLFDGQASYSIGCLALDPQNPETVWVGSGENVGGRHVGYGDGIYRSNDGGSTWSNMGLESSEHLSKIIVHPGNSDVVWVAAQGPLWSKGGERGVYKTTDGGATWTRTLGDDEWVGATDLLIDPRNPDVLYAATWQRQRSVAGYMGGGPGTALYKSLDGGSTWEKLSRGLPSSNMGKIGLGISPQNPDVVYAAIELDRRSGGVYRSEDGGASWAKMSDAVSGGTGPHYYQELFVSPHHADEIYLADNYMQVSYDGGKTFVRMNENEKHVDNHAVAFKKEDPNYILVGCDGGLYESFDRTQNWKFVDNLPVTQFYKLAVDDAEPFYYIYGGTQDNNTQGVISQTDNVHGIRNSDWFVVLGGDGHQPATEPGNPNIVYAQWQEGNLNRHDRLTGENIDIKPQAALGEVSERFNWDAPILVSPHKPSRLYFASQRVWKSEDRGDSWEAISPDLTNDVNRIELPYYGSKQKWDNPWDVYAMSNYSTITSLSESPMREGLIYAGTDDGIIQVTEDGGASWRKVNFSSISGLPSTAFVNDIKADLYNENVVYAVFDNHKYGDYNPYIYKSSDKGKTWESIASNLPERTLLWRVVQDFKEPNLMFLGSEFGVYVSQDGGKLWSKMTGGMPNISVRDLTIQRREEDLVLATFGRGIYVLDDYSSLRTTEVFEEDYAEEAKLFTPQKGMWYFPKRILGWGGKASQGDNFFLADNPPYGVTFTYFLTESYMSLAGERLKQEGEIEADGGEVAAPAYDILDEEMQSMDPAVWLFVYNEAGEIIRKVKATNAKGIHRVTWDYSANTQRRITAENMAQDGYGPNVGPGNYSAELFKQVDGRFTSISESVSFEVVQHGQGALEGNSMEAAVNHWETMHALATRCYALSNDIEESVTEVEVMLEAYYRAPTLDEDLHNALLQARTQAFDLQFALNGSSSRDEVGEKTEYPTLWTYLWSASGARRSTYGPTANHLQSLENAQAIYDQLNKDYLAFQETLAGLSLQLEELGAPPVKD